MQRSSGLKNFAHSNFVTFYRWQKCSRTRNGKTHHQTNRAVADNHVKNFSVVDFTKIKIWADILVPHQKVWKRSCAFEKWYNVPPFFGIALLSLNLKQYILFHLFFIVWASSFNPLLGRTRSRWASVEQSFDYFVIQNRQTVQSMGRSMDWTMKDHMANGLFFCATLTSRRRDHTPFV